MSQKILQLNFKLNVASSKYEQLAEQLAATFAEVPGLVWKVWLLNNE